MKLKWLTTPTFWGIMLILAGILFLLQNLGIFSVGSLFMAAGLGFFGILFLGFYLDDRTQWWALIPGFFLISLAILISANTFFPGISAWSGAIFLGGIALGFWAVYLTHREHWWAVIPGGVLFTLAIVSLLEISSIARGSTGGVFFFGLGLTFLLVAILPTPEGKMTWAYIPSTIMLLMGIFIIASSTNLMPYVGALLIIFFGIVLLIRAIRR